MRFSTNCKWEWRIASRGRVTTSDDIRVKSVVYSISTSIYMFGNKGVLEDSLRSDQGCLWA